MRFARCGIAVCIILLNGCAGAPKAPTPSPISAREATPLILERDEGERRIWRGWPGHPQPGDMFFIKVDQMNGGSSHLVFGTEGLAPGDMIETHKHPKSDEILFLQTGTTRVHLGDSVRVVHGGATVFIPAGTWVSLENIGRGPVNLAFVFSSPGFEDFMRAESVRRGEKNTPVSKAEDDALQKRLNVVIYK